MRALIALIVCGAAVLTAVPAQAQRHGHWHGGRDRVVIAPTVGVGILGLLLAQQLAQQPVVQERVIERDPGYEPKLRDRGPIPLK